MATETITVLFADLVGSTELQSRPGEATAESDSPAGGQPGAGCLFKA
jgi:hypothetical protein